MHRTLLQQQFWPANFDGLTKDSTTYSELLNNFNILKPVNKVFEYCGIKEKSKSVRRNRA
ncbi:MAG TPA: hypothetical protein PLA68_01760 [Panacibacter sp.]|nr:hypothetical protein [Panacibacter sp.]